MSLAIKIITPLGVVYEDSADFVVVPTVSGEISIHKDHMPLIAAISSGECQIVQNAIRKPFAVHKGILEVQKRGDITNVTLLVDRSEEASSIDVVRAEEALKRAEELSKETHESDVDFARFEALIDKELNRVKIGRKYK